jgi:hypothetical protein
MENRTIEYGKLSIDPVKNPAVLDTGTWDSEEAGSAVGRLTDAFWLEADDQTSSGARESGVEIVEASRTHRQGCNWALLRLPGGQRALVSTGNGAITAGPAEPFHAKKTSDGIRIACYETKDSVLDWYCRTIDPASGPRPMGATPRLGIGCRMSTAVWPGIWNAMSSGGFATNAIQNSLRELNLLEDLRVGNPPRSNYQFSFGQVQEGHTGSSFEGLWTEGVLSAIASGRWPRYGADADHIMVKRAADGLDRAKKIIDAARYYSFYTLDVSDLLDYEALSRGGYTGLEQAMPDESERRSVISYHRLGRSIGGVEYRPTEEELSGLYGKYGVALDAVIELRDHLRSLKGDVGFDLELSIDENPPEVMTCDNRTSDTELLFLLLESERRGLELTHVAPNLGVEKGVDYRCPEGLAELEERLRRQNRIAAQFGVMIDCHSGDDLSPRTRQVIGRATDGHIHFKVSPSLQVLFGQVLFDLHPDTFETWWDDAVAYAKREAEAGSSIASESLRTLASGDGRPDPGKAVFHHFNFATLGRRDEDNTFLSRQWFYGLPADVYSEYTVRLGKFLVDISSDVFGREEGS